SWSPRRVNRAGASSRKSRNATVPAPPEIVVGEAPVTNGPVFEDAPYTLEGLENTPYYPNNNDDD
ncbi:hypothetical protein NL491_27765, partial [Klebsiella pneumoniae]|nr:hypothetical protein [Klebsiella pneumoniae]